MCIRDRSTHTEQHCTVWKRNMARVVALQQNQLSFSPLASSLFDFSGTRLQTQLQVLIFIITIITCSSCLFLIPNSILCLHLAVDGEQHSMFMYVFITSTWLVISLEQFLYLPLSCSVK